MAALLSFLAGSLLVAVVFVILAHQSKSVFTDETPAIAVSTPLLVANVAASQGLFGLVILGLAWYTEIPAATLGLSMELSLSVATGVGVVVGLVFYALNEIASAVGRRRGLTAAEELREALAPESVGGWLVLLIVVLPIVASFEELLFRGALIGVATAGLDLSPWLLAVFSSTLFALGHGAQGRLGIVVTGLLGLGLAAVFIVTGSLWVVIVAHYVVNVCEFVVHEGLEVGC